MKKNEKDFLKRKVATRKYRDICWVSTEGQTEQDYLRMDAFKNAKKVIRFPKNIHPSRRNPGSVLKRFKKELQEADFRKNDEAWLVVDVDKYSEAELIELVKWSQTDKRYHLAISNPKFEVFLIMHFEKASGCTTAERVDATLLRYMPSYNKRLPKRCFTEKQISSAISNARTKRQSCKDAIPEPGMTDMYRLVEQLLDTTND